MLDMMWNPQYEIVAVVMLGLFLVFYHLQRALPIRKNYLFTRIMWTELIAILTDMIASYVTTDVSRYSQAFLYEINVIYFLCITSIYYLYYRYCVIVTEERANAPASRWRFFTIPFCALQILVAITPWTKGLFSITDQGYQRGWYYYPVLTTFILFYLMLALVFVGYYWRVLTLKERAGMTIFPVLVSVGSMLQMYAFPYILLTNICMTTGIAVLFLAVQNPEYERDRKTRVYSNEAFLRYVNEQIRWKKNTLLLGISFANYTNLKGIFGPQNMDDVLNRVGIHLRNHYPEGVAFYLEQGRFVLVLQSNQKKLEEVVERLQAYCKKSFTVNEEDHIYLQLRLVYTFLDREMHTAQEAKDVMMLASVAAQQWEDSRLLPVDKKILEDMRNENNVRRALRDALTKNEDAVQVYYQPIYDKDSKTFASAEALVRLVDPILGVIPPNAFIPIAENDGTILHLGMIVFRRVCEFIQDHDMEQLGIHYIEVNLSPIQCMHKGLAKELIETANRYDVPFTYFNFEITESTRMELEELRELMETLISHGASISLDDYGTGYSNLINVLSLPFQLVKIDKSIVWSYFDGRYVALPKITEMFREQGVTIVAEGAESKEMSENLQNLGCQYIQGFYHSKPLPNDGFVTFLNSYQGA